MNKIILVFYINVSGLPTHNAKQLIKSVQDVMFGKDENIIEYLIPTRSGEDRVECVNPVVLKESDYAEAKAKLEETKQKLNEYLNNDSNSRSES